MASKEFIEMKDALGLIKKIPCSKEENEKYAQMLKQCEPLPEGVFQYKAIDYDHIDTFYTVSKEELTDSETIQ